MFALIALTFGVLQKTKVATEALQIEIDGMFMFLEARSKCFVIQCRRSMRMSNLYLMMAEKC